MELHIETEDARLVNINGRIEHHGDDEELGSDIKFETEVNAAILNQLFAHDADNDEQEHLFDDKVPDYASVLFDRNGRPRLHRLDAIKCTTEFENHTLAINNKLQLHRVKVNKFSVKPLGGGRVNLTFRVQVSPDTQQIAQLFDWLQDTVTIDIQPGQQSDEKESLPLVVENQGSGSPQP